jgi:hypothetical protein
MPDIVAGIVAIGFLILWIYCIYDVITTDETIVRHLPKIAWLLIVVLIPEIGSILWLGLGRPQVWSRQAHDPVRYGSHRLRAYPPPAAVEPSLDHLNPIVRYREEQTRLRVTEAQRKRREEELRRRELDDGFNA